MERGQEDRDQGFVQHDMVHREVPVFELIRSRPISLATKRHKVHKKFESSIQQIIRFVAFVIFCG